jgi:hypothetical protein
VAESERRIVVEGVEFSQLVHFPKILRAVTASFQPPRLAMGLLLVAALMTGGRVWDWAFDRGVPPQGLTAEPWSAEQAEAAQAALRAALAASRIEPPAEGQIDAGAARDQVYDEYKARRAGLLERAGGSPEAAEELRRADEKYLETVRQIDAARPRGVFEATVAHVTGNFNAMVKGLATINFEGFYLGLNNLCVKTPIGMWRHDKLFAVVYGLFFVLVLAIGGGALARLAAVEVATGEKLRLQEAVDFALAAWRRLLFALLLPLLIAAALSVLLLVGGFFLMLPYLDILGGILYGIALLMGFAVVFLLAGYAAGFSLLVPAVACENCDAADAQQRAYAYVLSRPIHLLGYGFVACVGLAVGFVLASLFAVAALNVTGWLIDAATANAAVTVGHGFSLWNLSPRPESAIPLHVHSELSATFVMLWQTVVVCLVAGYVFAYYFSASTIVYLLMRRACDGQELDEVWEVGAAPGTSAELAPDEVDEDENEQPRRTAG